MDLTSSKPHKQNGAGEQESFPAFLLVKSLTETGFQCKII